MTTTLPLLCFNDVYRVNQRFVAQPGSPHDKTTSTSSSASPSTGSSQTISVSQFAQLVYDERAKWADRKGKGPDGEPEKDGLVLFAGDVFNPSVESSVTRGSHMVPIMNALKVDVACVGNHDFDFGYPHLTRLLHAVQFPWLLSNIVDRNTGHQPDIFKRFHVTERCGVRIGVIGLVEQDWIATIPSWPESFAHMPMKETALKLSEELRDPNGEHKVDIIVALTHCRVTNDIKLAVELGAVADKPGVENEHGVDLLVGGHDHIYYIGKGAKSWEGYAGDRDGHGMDADKGVRLIKSGTDFRDLSSASLELTDTPPKSVRRKLVSSLTGKHHYILPSSPSSKPVEELLKSLLHSVEGTLGKPVCFTLSAFDARSELVRTQETGLGNWIADVLMHAYAESLIEGGGSDMFEKKSASEQNKKGEAAVGDHDHNNGNDPDGVKTPKKRVTKDVDVLRRAKGGADAVIICGGTLRGDSQYGPGQITLGDILEILPFEDAVVCLEIDGKGIWDTMESALSKWPAQEGRFPIVSGLQVEWDHSLPPNKRVKSIRLINPPAEEDDEIESPEDMVDFVDQDDGTRIEVKQRKVELGEEVKNESGGRTYRVITRQYMADGYDGFEALKGRKFIIDDENGQIMSSIIRSFLLGSQYIFRHKQLLSAHQTHLSKRTDQVLDRARQQSQTSPFSSLASSPASSKLRLLAPPSPYREKEEPSYVLSPTSPGQEEGRRRHVVDHGWAAIRAALHVAKHEHMSDVDGFEGHEIRHSNDPKPKAQAQPKVQANKSEPIEIKQVDGDKKTDSSTSKSGAGTTATFLVDESRKDEMKAMADDLAVVCPLVDGRMRDLSA